MPEACCKSSLLRWCLVGLLLCSCLCSYASTYYVNPGGDIQATINAATDGDTIIVNAGTYNVHLDFGGKNLALRSSDPTDPTTVASTILDGTNSGSVVTFQSGESTAAVLSGFTIRNGRAQRGGGINISASSPTVTHNTVYDCVSIVVGGLGGTGAGLCGNAFGGVASDNTFVTNSAEGVGGGAYLINSTAEFSYNIVSGCTAEAGGGVALYSYNGAFTDNTLTGCSATLRGGGLYCVSSTGASLIGNTINNNSAPKGAGCYCSTSVVTTFGNCLFSLNNSPQGAGLYVEGCNPHIINCTFVRGSCGIYINGGSPIIDSCIIAWHTAGTGISKVGTGTAHVRYCGFWSNDAWDTDGVTLEEGCLSTNPLMVDPDGGKYMLKSRAGHWNGSGWTNDTVTSPCIDAGNPAFGYGLEPAPNGGRINMGYDGDTHFASRSATPLIVSSSPASGATGVNRRAAVTLNLSPGLRPASVQSHFHLYPAGGSDVAGVASWVTSRQLVFRPGVPLQSGLVYNIELSTGIRRTDGTVVNWNESRIFTTSAQPVVTTSSPNGTSVGPNANIILNFDQAMNRASVESALRFYPGVAPICTWSNGNRRLTMTHAPFASDSDQTVTVLAAARSSSGLRMGWSFSWTFHTAPAAAPLLTASAASTAAGTVAVSAALSAPAAVTVEVRNLAGRVVAALPERDLPAGLNTLAWNGKSTASSAVPAGQYLVTVTARSGKGAVSRAVCSLVR